MVNIFKRGVPLKTRTGFRTRNQGKQRVLLGLCVLQGAATRNPDGARLIHGFTFPSITTSPATPKHLFVRPLEISESVNPRCYSAHRRVTIHSPYPIPPYLTLPPPSPVPQQTDSFNPCIPFCVRLQAGGMYSPPSLPHSFLQPRPSSKGNCKPKSPHNASYCGSVIPLDVTLSLHRCKNLRTALSSPSRISAAPTAATAAASSSSSRRSSCLCSPSTHEGAFKCSVHRRKCRDNIGSEGAASVSSAQKLKRSVSNSPGGIRSEVARRALMRPHVDAGLQNPRRTKFERRPSRLSRVTMATP